MKTKTKEEIEQLEEELDQMYADVRAGEIIIKRLEKELKESSPKIMMNFEMNGNKKRIIQEATKVWIQLEKENAPVIYMDDDMNVGWHEEGDEQFWRETKTVFKFTSEVTEHEVRKEVLTGIDLYLNSMERSRR